MSHPFIFRPGTCDEEIFHAVFELNEYRLPDAFGPDDIILDIGTHIGSFCHAVLTRGARHVHGFEAFSKNYEQARFNLRHHGDRVRIQNKAVWRSDRPVETLTFTSLEHDNNSAGYIGDQARGETIPAVAFDAIVREVTANGRKRVKMVKIDCEGSEFPILFTSRTLHLVDCIVGEYHNYADNYDYGPGEDHFFHKIPEHAKVPGFPRYIHDDIATHLRRNGFGVETVPHPLLTTIAGWFFAYRIAPPSTAFDRLRWHRDGLKYKVARLRKAG